MQLARAALALVFVLAATGVAVAQSDDAEAGDGAATSKVSLYSDDDETTVQTTYVDGAVTLPKSITVGAHVLVDAVSSASVDVVSAATERWTENRIETGARLTAQIASAVEASVAYVRSGENDWISNSVQTTLARDLAKNNTRIQVGYGLSTNQVGRANDPTFERSLMVHTAEAGITQLIDKKTLASAALTLQMADGYLASPYRYVMTTTGISMPERHPETRQRRALSFRTLRSVSERVAVDASYRLYNDDWGIWSHTGATSLVVQAADSLDLRLRVRGYHQSSADFYADTYDTVTAYASADRELSRFWNVGGGAKATWYRGRWAVDAKVDVIYYEFLEFSELPQRVATVADLGVRLSW